MKVVIVSDGIFCRCGAERVLLNMHRAFPEAPIYTPVYYPESTFDDFKKCTIRTSWLQRIAKNEFQYKKLLLPWGIFAIRSFNFNNFDVVLLSTTHCSKYIKVSPKQFVIAYCHTPFRLLWSEKSYRLYCSKLFETTALRFLRKIDSHFAKRTNIYFTNSEVVRERIQNCYKPECDIHILPPPVHLQTTSISLHKGDFYLVVSRLEFYKRIDLAIQACEDLKRKLIVIGCGTQEKYLFRNKSPFVIHLKNISDADLAAYYNECKAVIFPQLEDYGIVPLEANAAGKPVIAYGKGGALETMIPYTGDAMKWTALFFQEQSVQSLKQAILSFESLTYDSEYIREHSRKFDEDQFVNQFKTLVMNCYADSTTKNR